MTISRQTILKTVALAAMSAMVASGAMAAGKGKPDCSEGSTDPRCGDTGGTGGGGGGSVTPAEAGTWWHSDVDLAHSAGYTGLGSHISVIDDFNSTSLIWGQLGFTHLPESPADMSDGFTGGIEQHLHGEWTSAISHQIAYGAEMSRIDFNSGADIDTGAVGFSTHDGALDVVNLSYGMIAKSGLAGLYLNPDNWYALGTATEDMLQAVQARTALAVQSAGNDSGAAVGESIKGKVDVLGLNFINLIGQADAAGNFAPVIFVGALQDNSMLDPDGTVAGTSTIASYSTIAGTNTDVQDHFLVVGVAAGGTATNELANYGTACGTVEGTCLYGTSFAAPVVTGYAAILGQKFGAGTVGTAGYVPADPSDVASRLLDTARTDTIADYSVEVYGQGEASLARALAPDGLWAHWNQ